MASHTAISLSPHALNGVKRRFLLRGERGILIEDAENLLRQVANEHCPECREPLLMQTVCSACTSLGYGVWVV
jgi:hypothetical protein